MISSCFSIDNVVSGMASNDIVFVWYVVWQLVIFCLCDMAANDIVFVWYVVWQLKILCGMWYGC